LFVLGYDRCLDLEHFSLVAIDHLEFFLGLGGGDGIKYLQNAEVLILQFAELDRDKPILISILVQISRLLNIAELVVKLLSDVSDPLLELGLDLHQVEADGGFPFFDQSGIWVVLLDNFVGLSLNSLVKFHVCFILLVNVDEVICLQHAHETLPLVRFLREKDGRLVVQFAVYR
jgi:hypothetical protein